jgi:hypothetical protein
MMSRNPHLAASCHAVHLPHVEALYAAPQLAVLAILETNAQVAILALGAAHPDIQDAAPAPDPDALQLHAAIAILDAVRTLAETINRYRLALVLAEQRDELLPF